MEPGLSSRALRIGSTDAPCTGDRLDRFDTRKCAQCRTRRKQGICARAALLTSVGLVRIPWLGMTACVASIWLAACETSTAPTQRGRDPATRATRPAASRNGPAGLASVAPHAATAVGPPAEAVAPSLTTENSRTSTRPPFAPDAAQPPPVAIQELSMNAEAASRVLASIPETRAFAAGFRPLSPQTQQRALATQRAQRGLNGVRSTAAALMWSPPRAEQVVVLSGDTPQGAVLVAYHPSPAGGARLAASYHTRGEHVPILLGTRPEARDELLFSTCWACLGEGGALRVDGDGRVRLLAR